MSGTRRWQRVAVLLLLLALLATACRGDDAAAPDDDGGAAGDGATETEDDGDGDATETEPADEGIATDVGVTEEPCPAAVNPDNGCIYLGVISDLTVGPFAPLAVPITDAQKAFWRRVNEQGGISGYDVDVETYIRDAEYNPEIHNRVFQEIRGDILALAQTLGSSQTLAIIGDMRADSIVGAPASWNSAWEFEDVILESGTNYCIEAANGVDWAVQARPEISSVMAIHYPNDYGADAAAGVQRAAERLGIDFTAIETPPGQDQQAGAIEAVLTQSPDMLFITTGPAEMAAIVGQAAARNYTGIVVGSSPTWNPALLQTAAAPALEALYFQAGPWGPWGTDTPGHAAMRETLADVPQVNDGYTAGWVWSYPMLAALEAAAEAGDLTRAGLLAAVQGLESVDYEGMLPAEAGNYAGDPSEAVFRQTVISGVDPDSDTGVGIVQDFFTGPTAEAMDFSEPCFELQ